MVWLLENMVDSRVVIPRGYSDLSRTGHWQGFALPVSGRSGSPGRSAAPGAGDRDPASGAIAEPHRLTHRFNPCILREYPVKDIFKKSAKE